MEQTLPKEESMPVVSALEKFFYYLSCTKHSAWHLIDVTNELVKRRAFFFSKEYPVHLTNKEISYLPFRSYRKVASFRLRARRLTQEDVEQRGGVIHTMEGPVAFQPGDYLARGIQGEEYPIRPEAFAMLYDVDTLEPDTEGFASYRSAPLLHQAAQITEPFTVERADGGLFTGKAGDYVMRTVGLEGARIVDRSIFEQIYERIGNV
jgi:hypothetical protein